MNKKLFSMLVMSALVASAPAVMAAESDPTATPSATPASTAVATSSPSASPEASASPSASPKASASPSASATPVASATPEAESSVSTSYAGTVESVDGDTVTFDLVTSEEKLTAKATGLKVGDSVIVTVEDKKVVNVGKVSEWFYQEAAEINFPVIKTDDYTVSATRVEFAELIYNMLANASKIEDVTENPFKDTDSKAVAALNKLGIIEGVSETEFAPESPLTREAGATILDRTREYLGGEFEKLDTKFKDDDQISDWAKESVYNLVSSKIIYGTGDNFEPQRDVTLEETLVQALRFDKQFIEPVEIPNPMEKHETYNELIDELGFVPTRLGAKDGLTLNEIYCVDKEIAHLVYTDADKHEIIVRSAKGDKDISGIYGGEKTSTEVINESSVDFMKYEDTVYATFTVDTKDYLQSVSIAIDGGDDKELKTLVENSVTEKMGVNIPNPMTEYKTVSELEKKLDFTPAVIDSKDYTLNKVYSINDEMAQITYKNADDKEVTVRSASGDRDVSGIYGGEKTSTETIAESSVDFMKYEDIVYATFTVKTDDGLQSISVLIDGGTLEELKTVVEDMLA